MAVKKDASMKKLILIAFFLFLTSCSYQIKFVDWEDGHVLKGRYNELTPTIEVTMPSGEKLVGDDIPYEKVSFGKDDLFHSSGPKSGIVGFKPGTYSTSSTSVNRFARLTGNKGTVMEIIYKYNITAGQGYGWAKTSDGRDYDVFFSNTKITAKSGK